MRKSSLPILLLFCASAFAAHPDPIRFVGKTKYLNNARAVVSHNIDDSTRFVTDTIDAMDKYGIKATMFISTEMDPAPEDRFFNQLQIHNQWPRMQKAIDDGHEIGSHSRQHPCKRPDTEAWCSESYNDYEVVGSRDDILKFTKQPYVWTWCYPCGHCANYELIQKKIAAAGYIVARNYPDEPHDGHIMPNLQTWDTNPMNAAYTQVVQKRGGAAKTERLDVAQLNAKFDEIYEKGGIYNFMSHPQWLDFGPDGFYERHLSHLAHKRDVWYVPMGPLYAFKAIHDKTDVQPMKPTGVKARFRVTNNLDRKIYNGSITLDFEAPEGVTVLSQGRQLSELGDAMTDRWDREYIRREGGHLFVTVRSNTVVEFR